MNRTNWTMAIRRWFEPYCWESNDTASNRKVTPADLYSGGRSVTSSSPESTLRTVVVYTGGFDPYPFECGHLHQTSVVLPTTDPLKQFRGKCIALDENHLVLLDETFAPTLIPWEDIRHIEVE